MIDVGGNDCASGSHFISHKLSGDMREKLCAERLSRMLKVYGTPVGVLCGFECVRTAHVLANRDELHLGSYDAAPGVVNLRDRMARLRSKRAASSARERLEASVVFQQRVLASAFRQVAIVLRSDIAPF